METTWRGSYRASMRPLALSIALLLVALADPVRAAAQIVQGQVRDAASQAPVQGALVLLLDAGGRQVGGFLTDEAGSFRLRAPEAGRYALRAERIGFETVTSDSFVLRPGPALRMDLAAAGKAVALEGIRVEGEKRCVVRPAEGLALARVWDEAQKVLRNQEWTDQMGLARFRLEHYERELDPETRMVLSETRRFVGWTGQNPIRSLPVEDLLANGFIREAADGGYTFLGPDAAVLLSDAFLETHCFSLETNDRERGLIGLGFEPLRRRRAADIAGTLWLGRADAKLRFLTFRYTSSPWPEASGVANGRVEFDELPGGAWVIRRWWIRMPRMAQDLGLRLRGLSGLRVAAIVEAGGAATRVDATRPVRVHAVRSGTIRGIVWDSMQAAPLEGAEVLLSTSSFSTVTDEEGRFTIDGVPEGSFLISIRHPRLDSLPVQPAETVVDVLAGDTSDVSLGVPSLASVLSMICGEADPVGGSSAVMGFVRSPGEPGEGSAVSGAAVTLEWAVYRVVGGREVQGDVRWVSVTTDDRGRYTACGIPPGVLLTGWATLGNARGGSQRIEIPRGAIVRLDLPAPPAGKG